MAVSPRKPYQIASILPPRPVSEPFDYLVPDTITLIVGSFVRVPFGSQTLTALVLTLRTTDAPRRTGLKSVLSVCADTPCLPPSCRDFIDRASAYTCSPKGALLAMTMRAHGALEPSPTRPTLSASGTEPSNMTEPRRAVLTAAADQPRSARDLARTAGVSASVVAGLVAAGSLHRKHAPIDMPYDQPDAEKISALTPTGDQKSAAETLCNAISENAFRPILLDGVTGSGKTLVYLEAVAHALRQDGQILILTPEIALANQVARRVTERFGAEQALWHADVRPASKRRAWREIAHGRARIVVGARSALFLPFRKLALIVVDEEHDPSYKQGDGILYQARDLAVLRAQTDHACIVLASATPSLETINNVESGRYQCVRLANRTGCAQLPEISLVDLRAHPPPAGRALSPLLLAALTDTLEAGEQALLFLNRRGYAPLVMCRACGEKLKAPDTDSWLSEHRASNRLVCHITGFSMPRPESCPHCGGKNCLIGIGPGVERVAEEARRAFPSARIAVFSSDTARSPAAAAHLITRMEHAEIDILVGTQIIAKGHHFPLLTLVGVVDADSGLVGGDLRASERTFQLLSQVAGRAGRATRPGRAIIQTHAPGNALLNALANGDRETFIQTELQAREMMGMPPFGRLAAVILSATGARRADAAAQALALAVPRTLNVDVWGPAPAPISVLRGRDRRRFLVRSARSVNLSAYLTEWKKRADPPASVRVTLDMEPYNFL